MIVGLYFIVVITFVHVNVVIVGLLQFFYKAPGLAENHFKSINKDKTMVSVINKMIRVD